MTEGETAESVEVAPDGLTYTFKLRQNMVWDKRAPTNNRAIDSSDVLFSWDRFSKLNASVPNFVYVTCGPYFQPKASESRQG